VIRGEPQAKYFDLHEMLFWLHPVAESPFMTAKEYAAFWKVHPSTVMRWIRKGRIPAEQPNGPHGEYFIPRGARPAPVGGWPRRLA